MKNRILLVICTILINLQFISAQCSCTDCPVNTISNATVTSVLNISGATSNVLGQSGQELVSIYLDYDTDAVNEVNMTLIAPNGSSVLLMQETGLNISQNINFKICFNSCDGTAIPDPGFSEIFDSNEDWMDNTDYGGTYYPAGSNPNTGVGCFETLTGSVNGDWTLEIQDVVGQDDGVVNDWFLVFANNSGTDCNDDLGCALAEMCEADGGELDNTTIEACEGDPLLDVILVPLYPNSTPPDASEYGYTGVVYNANTGVIIEYSDDPDLTGYLPGSYTFCGLSYLLDDVALIPPADGSYTIANLEADIAVNLFCGDLSDECNDVLILDEPNPNFTGPTEVCQGQLVQYIITNPELDTDYAFVLNMGGFSFFDDSETFLDIILESGPAQICVNATNACGTVTQCIDITVGQSVDNVEITGPEIVCTNDISNYFLSPSPQGGEAYNIVVTGGTIQNSNENTVTIIWDTPNITSGEICVTLLGGSCPSEEVCLLVAIQDVEIPDQIFTNTPICLGQTDFASVMANPTIINYIWELTNLELVTGNNTPTVTYTTIDVGLATVCLVVETACGFSDPICENIQVTEAPSPQLFITSPVCDLEFSLAATTVASSVVEWELVSGPGTAVIAQINSPSTSIVVSEPGIYEFMITEDNNGCISSGIISVEVFPPLDLVFIDFSCSPIQEYEVTLSITGGQQPYFVNNIQLNGTIFTADAIPSGDVYNFLITDSQGCEIPLITGVYECLCNTDSGDMEEELLEACGELGESVQASAPSNSIYDIDDIGQFYLHDNPGNILGNILANNSTGVFEFQPPMIAGVTYYISFVVGQAQNGIIDLMNPCTSVSLGQPVVFYPKPSISVEAPETICGNSFYVVLSDSMSLDLASWVFQDGPQELSVENVNDSVFFMAPEPGDYTYNLELSNAFCDTTIIVEFSVLPIPEIVAVNQLCSLDPAFYTLTFEMIGGDAPYTSSIAGDFVGQVFTSMFLDASIDYTIIVADSNGCETMVAVNPIDCSCDINLGTIITDTISLCEDEFIDPNDISSGNYIFDESVYDIAFYTYDSPDGNITDFIEFSYGDPIFQNGIYTSGQVYFIRMIISTPMADPMNGLNLDDPCTIVSISVPFIWRDNYSFVFDIHPTVCTSELFYNFDFDFDGPFPYTVGFTTIDGIEVFFDIDEVTEEISLPIFDGGVAWELTSFDGNCSFTSGGNLTITGETPVEFTLSEVDTICNNAFFGSVLILDQLLSDPTLFGTWELDGNIQSGNEIDFDGFTEGAYSLVFTTNGGSGSCPLVADTINIQIADCTCPVVIMNDFTFCNNETSIDLNIFTNTTIEGSFSINNINGLTDAPFIIPDDNLSIENTSGGDYEIIYTLTGDWPDDCQTEFISILSIADLFTSGTALEPITLCQGEEESINLYDLLEGNDEGGSWYYLDLPISDVIETAGLNVGIWEYTYFIDSEFPCPIETTDVIIEIVPNPDITVLSDDVLCYGDTNGALTIEISNPLNGPYICELNGVEQTEKTINGLAPGFYTVEVSNVFGCSVTIDSLEIKEPEVLEIDLGADVVAFYNDLVTINALLNILESDIGSITWQDLDGIIDENDLTLIKNAIRDNQISLTITDANGCVATDNIQIRLVETDIDLANIFVPNSDNPDNRRFGMPEISSVVSVLDFQIYDRWGNRVFDARNIAPGAEEGYWYGDFAGEPVSQGVYAYVMTFLSVSGEEVVLIGDVTVMR